MRLTEIDFQAGLPIEGYGPGYFRIADQPHPAPLLLGPGGPVSWRGLEDAASLIEIGKEVDVIFIGTGPETRHIPQALCQALEARHIAFEPMNSPAACRTYNILLSEGRRIAVALLDAV